MEPLSCLVSVLLGLVTNELSEQYNTRRREKLEKALGDRERRARALASFSHLDNEVRRSCLTLHEHRSGFTIPHDEQPLWELLRIRHFHTALADFLKSGSIPEGEAAREKLIVLLDGALPDGPAKLHRRERLRTQFLGALDRLFIEIPILRDWRIRLSLDYLRSIAEESKRLLEQLAGHFTPAQQDASLAAYRDYSLDAWDIIDLKQFRGAKRKDRLDKKLLRELYTPLRVTIESIAGDPDLTIALEKAEERRDQDRLRDAGHLKDTEEDAPGTERHPIGHRLDRTRCLVVLGDPGAGKTTLLRWLATAQLLPAHDPEAFRQLPDRENLPAGTRLPILIRCRDIGPADLSRCFTTVLHEHLGKTPLQPAQARILEAVLLRELAEGRVLLLIDGLDEIADQPTRVRFSQEIEQTAARYPAARILVTSRIVGYRDMPYRMGADFEHTVIAPLSPEEKNDFAARWIRVTEETLSEHDQKARAADLIADLHSSERIERLTGNALLLTMLCLVKESVGKLPTKRHKLYRECIILLLDWNHAQYNTISEEEALPQLAYIAHDMISRGEQRITEARLLTLLTEFRAQYPHLYDVQEFKPREFLQRLEARSSLIIHSGGSYQVDRAATAEQRLWEFRHLSFQEWLAAHALIKGYYSGYDDSKSLAEHVGPIAGAVKYRADPHDAEISDSWQETLRLLCCECDQRETEKVLRAILDPQQDEKPEESRRPRAILAARCLADEPPIRGALAEEILKAFVFIANSDDSFRSNSSPAIKAANELGRSRWRGPLVVESCREFSSRPGSNRESSENLVSTLLVEKGEDGYRPSLSWLEERLADLSSLRPELQIRGALGLMDAAFRNQIYPLELAVPALLKLAGQPNATWHAGVWALWWLTGGHRRGKQICRWNPDAAQSRVLIQRLHKLDQDELGLMYCTLMILRRRQPGILPLSELYLLLGCFGWNVHIVQESALLLFSPNFSEDETLAKAASDALSSPTCLIKKELYEALVPLRDQWPFLRDIESRKPAGNE